MSNRDRRLLEHRYADLPQLRPNAEITVSTVALSGILDLPPSYQIVGAMMDVEDVARGTIRLLVAAQRLPAVTAAEPLHQVDVVHRVAAGDRFPRLERLVTTLSADRQRAAHMLKTLGATGKTEERFAAPLPISDTPDRGEGTIIGE